MVASAAGASSDARPWWKSAASEAAAASNALSDSAPPRSVGRPTSISSAEKAAWVALTEIAEGKLTLTGYVEDAPARCGKAAFGCRGRVALPREALAVGVAFGATVGWIDGMGKAVVGTGGQGVVVVCGGDEAAAPTAAATSTARTTGGELGTPIRV